MLRIGVNTKGCSGLVLRYELGRCAGPGRRGRHRQGLTVLVDRKASLFLIGTMMDYETKQLRRRLHLHQPERKGPLRLRRELPRLNSLALNVSR